MTSHDKNENFRVPDAEIHRRIASLQKQLRREAFDAALIIQRADLFYFSGTAQNGCLYVPADGEPLLLIRKYMPRAELESAIPHIVEIGSVKEVPGRIFSFYGALPRKLGFELDVLPVRDFNFYHRLFDPEGYAAVAPLIHTVRQIKSEWDIACMEENADLSHRIFEHARNLIAPGLTGYDLSAELEIFARKQGHSAAFRIRDRLDGGYCRGAPVAGYTDPAGSFHYVSTVGPWRGGDPPIKSGDPILINIGTVVNGWHLEETRMFAPGTMPESTKNAAMLASEVLNTVIETIQPGMSAGDLIKTAARAAKQEKQGTHSLLSSGCTLSFTGRGLGIEWREPPFLPGDPDVTLQPGMTLSLNAGVFKESRLVAAIKSVVLINAHGMRRISRSPEAPVNC